MALYNEIKSRKRWIITSVCMLVFFILAYIIISYEIVSIDTYGYDFISNHLISDKLTPIVRIFTNLGGTIWLIAFSFILAISSFIIAKNKKLSIFFVGNLAFSAGLNFIIKNILRRPRPIEEYRLITEKGFSFPSGHSMVSMAVYGFIIYLIAKKVKNTYIKIISISLLSVLIISIGISRIYLGVHYTSDVLAGFMLGITYLTITTHFIREYVLEKA